MKIETIEKEEILKVYDEFIVFPDDISESLRKIIGSPLQYVMVKVQKISSIGDHDLQRDIDTMHYFLQLGANDGSKEICAYSNEWKECRSISRRRDTSLR